MPEVRRLAYEGVIPYEAPKLPRWTNMIVISLQHDLNGDLGYIKITFRVIVVGPTCIRSFWVQTM